MILIGGGGGSLIGGGSGDGGSSAALNSALAVQPLIPQAGKLTPPLLPWDALGIYDFTTLGAGVTIVKNVMQSSVNTRTGIAGSAFVGVTTTCTVTLANHGYAAGATITVSGVATLANANITATILTAPTANTFTYAIASQSATGSGSVAQIVDHMDLTLTGSPTIASTGVSFTANTMWASSPPLTLAVNGSQTNNSAAEQAALQLKTSGPWTIMIVADADNVTDGHPSVGIASTNLKRNVMFSKGTPVSDDLFGSASIPSYLNLYVNSQSSKGMTFHTIIADDANSSPIPMFAVNSAVTYNRGPSGTPWVCLHVLPTSGYPSEGASGTLKVMFMVLCNRKLTQSEIHSAWAWMQNYLVPKGFDLSKSEPPLIPYIKPISYPKPHMGWGSFPRFLWSTTDAIIKGNADAIVNLGLNTLGYTYVIPDGTPWDSTKPPFKDQFGNWLPPQDYLPNRADGTNGFKVIGDYLHAKGLKYGIYSQSAEAAITDAVSPPVLFLGSHGNEQHDAQMFANWGVDYVKYDKWSLQSNDRYRSAVWGWASTHENLAAMGTALQATGRPILYAATVVNAVCVYNSWSDGVNLGMPVLNVPVLTDSANTTGTIGRLGWTHPQWSGVELRFSYFDDIPATLDYSIDSTYLHNNIIQASWTGPGKNYFNDYDYVSLPSYTGGVNLAVQNTAGNAGLTDIEGRTWFSFMCILATPLVIDCDLRGLTTSDATYKTMANTEAIAVDQDLLAWQGIQAKHTSTAGSFVDSWVRPLADGSWCLGIFNRTSATKTETITWATIATAVNKAKKHAYQTVTGTNITVSNTTVSVTHTAHGYQTGDRLTFTGLTGNVGCNGDYVITVDTADTYHYTVYNAGSALSGSCGGTATITTPNMDTAMKDYPAFDASKSYAIRDLWGVTNGTNPVLSAGQATTYTTGNILTHACLLLKLTPAS